MKAGLILVVLLSQIAFATSYTSTQSGDFNTNSTWGGTGHPLSGDTWTITSGTTVTCSGTCAAGRAAASTCSVDGMVSAGGTLSIAAGATLTHSGELDVQHSGTINVNANASAGSGTLAIAPGSGATCKLSFVNLATGAPTLNLTGAAGSGGHNYPAVLSCNTVLHGGAGCSVSPEAGGVNANLNFSYFQVTGFGGATLKAFASFGVNSVNFQNGLFDRNGDVHLALGNCGNCNFILQNVAFTHPIDVSGSGNHYTVFEFYGNARPTGGTRSIQNVTAASQNPTQRYTATIGIAGAQTGQSVQGGDPVNANGFVGYNVSLLQSQTTSLAQIFRSSAVVLDVGTEGASCYGTLATSTLTFQDSLCLDRLPNPHEIVAGSFAAGGSANLYQRYLCDGDGFFKYDTGDLIQDWGTYTLKNSIGINFCGTMTTVSNGSTEVATVTQNTNFNNFGETYCETACYDGVHPVFRNNLIVKPADVAGTGIRGDDGIHAAAAFLRQTNFSLDYNGFYQMPGSGDSGAELQPPVAPLLPNPALGGIISYVNVPGSVVGGQVGLLITTVSDPMHVGCSSCNFTQAGPAGVKAGDYFEDYALKKVATVASVTDSTHLVLTSPGISGMRAGMDSLDVFTSYWNHPGWYYGDSNNGSHDIHSNPLFVDSTRTLCSWYKANSGAALSCPTYGSIMSTQGMFLASAGSSGTTIVCSKCNFTGNGITTADVVRVFVGGGTQIRGWSNLSAVTATTLTLTTQISGLTTKDSFDFITSSQGLGKTLVQSAGFDWNGNPVVPPSWANVAGAMQYVYGGFTPRNYIYKNAGSPADGFPDIGAVEVGGVNPLQ